MATTYFHYQAEYQLTIYREYRHAVWPDQVEGHLQGKQHRMGRKQAELIGGEVRGRHGLIMFPSDLEVPARVEQPIAELPLFKDGLLCQKDPGSCQYICRDTKGDKMTIKKHWRVEHGWSVGGSRGRLSRRAEGGLDKRLQEAAKQVYCQRFFPGFYGSQYFEVCQPEQA